MPEKELTRPSLTLHLSVTRVYELSDFFFLKPAESVKYESCSLLMYMQINSSVKQDLREKRISLTHPIFCIGCQVTDLVEIWPFYVVLFFFTHANWLPFLNLTTHLQGVYSGCSGF